MTALIVFVVALVVTVIFCVRICVSAWRKYIGYNTGKL